MLCNVIALWLHLSLFVFSLIQIKLHFVAFHGALHIFVSWSLLIRHFSLTVLNRCCVFYVHLAVPVIWQDLMSSESTFPGRAHALCRWYGLRDFVVVMPAPNMEDIVSENRVNMLLSSFAMAANNTSW